MDLIEPLATNLHSVLSPSLAKATAQVSQKTSSFE